MNARIAVAVSVLVAAVACAAPASGPTSGTYTIDFPSTAAAVATDYVQILVFDVLEPGVRATLCEDLIATRLSEPTRLQTAVAPFPASNICEMLVGKKAVPVPYGEHALLAIAQREGESGQLEDFMIGCAIMTIGEGNAPAPIPVRLVDEDLPVPETKCKSVADYCGSSCD